MSFVRWDLIDEGERLVLSPSHVSIRSYWWLIAIYLACGLALTVAFFRLGREAFPFVYLLPLPLSVAVSYAVPAIWRAVAAPEVRRGPSLIWDRHSNLVELPQRGLKVPRNDLECLEYCAGWTRAGRTVFYMRELHVVIRVDGRLETHPVLVHATSLKRLAAALSAVMQVRVERL